MAEEKKTETRRRRLKGRLLGGLRAMMKKLERAVRALNRKRDDILDNHDAFKDQVNWNTGVIYDVAEKDAEGKTEKERAANRIPIGRITKEEEKEQRALVREIEAIDGEIGDMKWEIAEKLGCFPEDIDPANGQIKGSPVDHLDPDNPPKPEEAEAPAEATTEEAPADGPVPLPMTG